MFDFVCEKEGQEGEGEPEQWRKRTYAGVTRCAGRRDASRRHGQTDGGAAGNYVARTERPRNRNSCSRPLVIPPGHQDPDVLLPAHLRTSVSHLSPPYPASTTDRSPLRVHASGRPTIMLPEEHRTRYTETAPTPFILSILSYLIVSQIIRMQII